MRALALRERLELSRCTAYSDSYNDLPMLQAVDTAVAINPDPDLRAAAREYGWAVYDYRTGRKVAKYTLRTALGAGAVTGGIVAGRSHRRRRAALGAETRDVVAGRSDARRDAALSR